MKKYIIIVGVPRAGKSTVSQMIAKQMGYQHISMDSVIAGIEKVFPETKIDTDSSDDLQSNLVFISSKMAPFIRAMMDSGEYDECDYGVVIDIYQLLPVDYMNFLQSEKCEIECTGKDGIGCIETSFDCNELKRAFELHGIATKVSSNAGTSFCNQLYVNSLRYISKCDMKTKIVFIHIPFLKNISDTSSFFRKIIDTIETFLLQ